MAEEVRARLPGRGCEVLRDCLVQRKHWVLLAVALCTEKQVGLKELEILSLLDSVLCA